MPSPRRNPVTRPSAHGSATGCRHPMRACSKCPAFYDCANGRDAHQVVFGHQPATLVRRPTRTWFRWTTPGVAPRVPSDAGNKAMGLGARRAWSAQQLTDGFAAHQVVGMLGGTRADAQRLTDARLWVARARRVAVPRVVRSAAVPDKVVAERDAAAERNGCPASGRQQFAPRHRHRKSHRDRGPSHGVTSASVTPTHVTPPTRPDPTRPTRVPSEPLRPPGGGSPPTPLLPRPRHHPPDIEALCTRLAERIEANGSRRRRSRKPGETPAG